MFEYLRAEQYSSRKGELDRCVVRDAPQVYFQFLLTFYGNILADGGAVLWALLVFAYGLRDRY